jgi:hypothetical protein
VTAWAGMTVMASFSFLFLSKNHLNTIHHPFIFGEMSDDVTEKLFHLIVLYTIVLG